MPAWRCLVFAVLAGDDKLADAKAAETMVRSIDINLLHYSFQLKNYHDDSLNWTLPRIGS